MFFLSLSDTSNEYRLVNEYFKGEPKIFVYKPPIKPLSRFIGEPSFDLALLQFQQELRKVSGINFQIGTKKTRQVPVTLFSASNFNSNEDWLPHFSFSPCNKNRGVYIHGLRLPKELCNKGIGSFCVRWLKDFIKQFSYDYIVLRSFEESEGFWRKMGFQKVENKDEWSKYYP